MISINNIVSMSLMILSATMITFGSLARKFLMNIDGIYFTMLICFVGGSILMWWIVCISSFKKITPFNWRSVYIRVCLGLFAQILFFISLSKGSLLITILLFNTSPLFIPVINFIFFKRKISYYSFICILSSFFGIYLVLGTGPGINLFALCALFSGILNAASQVVLHDASKKENIFIINLWIYTFIGILMIIFLPLNKPSLANFDSILTQPIITWSCITIIVLSISSQIFRVKAFKYTKDPSFIAPGMYFSVIVAVILDSYMYHISLSYSEILGVVIVCLASILSIVKK